MCFRYRETGLIFFFFYKNQPLFSKYEYISIKPTTRIHPLLHPPTLINRLISTPLISTHLSHSTQQLIEAGA